MTHLEENNILFKDTLKMKQNGMDKCKIYMYAIYRVLVTQGLCHSS